MRKSAPARGGCRREGKQPCGLRNEGVDEQEWPLWEIFIRSQHGLAHKHVGSLHAPDAEMAIKNARDVYTRRNEGVSIWVVRSADIAASSPADKDSLFEPANEQGVPASDVLPDAGRSEAPVTAPDIVARCSSTCCASATRR